MSLREQKKQRLRRQILDVCGELFRKQGFDETTVDEIVEQVGISRQTFFNYFASKEAVLATLGMGWLFGQMGRARRWLEDPERARSGPVRSLLDGLRLQLRAIEADREFMRLVFTRSGVFFPSGSHVGSASDEDRIAFTRRGFEAIADIVRAAQRAGELRAEADPLQVAELYVAVLTTTIRLWLTDYWNDDASPERGGSLEERGLRSIELLLVGLLPESHELRSE